MTDVDAVLKSVLSGLGANVYAIVRPADSPLPALVYRRISEKNFLAHGARVSLTQTRFEITHVASTYSGLRSLVSAVEAVLIGNNTNFNASVASELHIETKEDVSDVFMAQKDYLIFSI